MADGHISDRGLHISLSEKDKEHLSILQSHLKLPELKLYERKAGYKPGSNYCSINIEDKGWATYWKNMLSIKSAKTYVPPDLSLFLTKENFIYFLIGFLDGDACLWLSKNHPNIRLEIHSNWMPMLEKFSEILLEYYNIESRTRYSNRGYAQLIINKKPSIKIFEQYLFETDFMKRKWIKILSVL